MEEKINMKVKVMRTYIDAETFKVMDAGSVAEYAPERARGLIEKGFVEEVKEKEEKSKKETKPTKTPAKKAGKKK